MNLKEFLEKYDMNPVVFAVKVGCSPASVWLYLKGRKPQQEIAEKIENFTGGLVTVKELRNKDARDKRKPRRTVIRKRSRPASPCIKDSDLPSNPKRPFTFEEAKRALLSDP